MFSSTEEIFSIKDWHFCTDIQGGKREDLKEPEDTWQSTKHSVNEFTRIIKCEGHSFSARRVLQSWDTYPWKCYLTTFMVHSCPRKGSPITTGSQQSCPYMCRSITAKTSYVRRHCSQAPLFWHAPQVEVISKMHNGPPSSRREFQQGHHTTGVKFDGQSLARSYRKNSVVEITHWHNLSTTFWKTPFSRITGCNIFKNQNKLSDENSLLSTYERLDRMGCQNGLGKDKNSQMTYNGQQTAHFFFS